MADRNDGEPRLPMRVVMERTGLTADLLRAWERRYGVVRPQRTGGGQRRYTEQDVALLALLHRATRAGHRIADLARLDRAALERLLEPAGIERMREPVGGDADAVVRSAMHATERLDGSALETTLKRAALALGIGTFVDEVVARFLTAVGDRWHAGEVSPAHEHLATNVVRRVIDWVIDACVVGARAPRFLVATPEGERHELGAMLAAAAAAEEGWRVWYLGPSLPAADIAAAAAQVHARAVGLSAVALRGHSLQTEVRALAAALAEDAMLFVGGCSATDDAERLQGERVQVLADIPSLRRVLRALRAGEVSGDSHGGESVPAPRDGASRGRAPSRS